VNGHDSRSIPDVSFVDRDAVFLAEPPELVLKTLLAMVFLLPINVTFQVRHVGRAQRKCTVTELPMEVRQAWFFDLNSFRRIPLQIAEEVLHFDALAEPAENMHVVLDAAGLDQRAPEIVADPGQVRMDALAEHRVAEKRLAVFGRKDKMQVDLHQGL
jgi:hypothetical protein